MGCMGSSLCGVVLVSDWFPPGFHGFPTGFRLVSNWFPTGFRQVSDRLWFPTGFGLVSEWFRVVSDWFQIGFRVVSDLFPTGFRSFVVYGSTGTCLCKICSIR